MKKFIVLLLSVILTVTAVPATGFAAATGAASNSAVVTKGDTGSSTEPSDQDLEGAITAVKSVITIPKEFSKFDYNLINTNTNSDSYWSLNWTNPETYASIQVNCDMNNHITCYYKYDYNNRNTGIAKYLKSELKENADAFIKKIAPEVSKSIQFIDADYQGIYSANYIFNYKRVNNDIEFPDNKVTVGVNSITGEVTSATISWLYDATVPAADVKLTKDEATAILKKNLKMKLVYRSDYLYPYDSTINTAQKAYLVYQPSMDYISVDAKTGEVYTTSSQWNDTTALDDSTMALKASSGGSSDTENNTSLTEEEAAKVKELKNLISKSDAIKKVTGNKYLYLDKHLTSYTATLQKNWDTDGDCPYIWSISLNDPRKIDTKKDQDSYRAYAYANVDAKTGKILSFYSSMKSTYNDATQKWDTAKIAYDKKQGRKILEKFLKSQAKDRFENTVLSSQDNDYIAYYKGSNPVFGGYTYQYTRVNQDIEYPNNYISGAVDGVTGKIYNYDCTWNDKITFESPKGAISADEALNYYLSKDGYGLKYDINTKYKTNKNDANLANAYNAEYQIRLVYRPDIDPCYISPFTGEQLNANGEVYTKAITKTYKDIDNSAKYRNILLLSDMNIGFEGENFLPDQYIKIGEINQLLSDVGYYSNSDDSDQSDSEITREQLAQLLVNKLGYSKLSQISGIYKTGYGDEGTIDSKYIGAVALCKGLGIMGAASDNNFNPKKNVTRFDAVDIILNFIDVQQKSMYDN